MDNKGQAILSEYVMIFFVVVAAAVAVTTFVQRGFEARVHDARNFMVDSVNSACDANCHAAAGVVAGGNIPHEYEPYYSQMLSDVQQNEQDNLGAARGKAQVLGAVYYKSINEATKTISTSDQLPPCASANPVPDWCNKMPLHDPVIIDRGAR